MSELANYSIETDHTVLLAFSDGRRLRVAIGQLPHHLAPPDLAKVRASLKLRRDFIKDHMPKAALILVAGGLLALLAVGGKEVARVLTTPTGLEAPDSTGIVRSQTLEPSPGATPNMQPEKGKPVVASIESNPSDAAAKLKKKAAKVLGTPAPKVTPVHQPSISPLPVSVPPAGNALPNDDNTGLVPDNATGGGKDTPTDENGVANGGTSSTGNVLGACDSTTDPIVKASCMK